MHMYIYTYRYIRVYIYTYVYVYIYIIYMFMYIYEHMYLVSIVIVSPFHILHLLARTAIMTQKFLSHSHLFHSFLTRSSYFSCSFTSLSKTGIRSPSPQKSGICSLQPCLKLCHILFAVTLYFPHTDFLLLYFCFCLFPLLERLIWGGYDE